MTDLPTVDLDAVEILRAGVRIHGRGSLPGGDVYSSADLRALCEAHAELVDELHPVATIGHDGDRPAVGRLENLRVNGDGTRLLCDVRGVPRTFADLVRSKAYGARSIELSRVTSPSTGRVYEKVVSALAFLGGRLPAVKGLADVIALYEHDPAGGAVTRMYVVHADAQDADDDAYSREFEARFGETPFLSQSDDIDPESREIAARLGLNPTEVL